MKKLLFANGFKAILLLVLLSFVFGCEKDKDIKPSTDGVQLPDSTSEVPVFINRNKNGTRYYIINRWIPVRGGSSYFMYGDEEKVFMRSMYPVRVDEYRPLSYGHTEELWPNSEFMPFQFHYENLGNGYIRLKEHWSGLYINTYNEKYYYAEMSDIAVWEESSQWSTEYAATDEYGVHYWRIKNRKTGLYLNIQNLSGHVQCTTDPRIKEWYSAQWDIRVVDYH